jgi:ribosomal-protein-alanine N-acetyltransferase
VRIPALRELERAPIETARLLLLPLTTSLASEMFDALDSSREHIDRWQNFSHWTQVGQVRIAIDASVKQWDAGTDARFAMIRKADGRFLGSVSVEEANRMHASGSLAYWIRADAAKQRYTTEASQAVVSWGFDRVGFHRLRSVIAVGNDASIRLTQRLGFRLEGTMREAERIGTTWHDALIFGLLHSDARPWATRDTAR